jgi:hypothetical protein
MNETLEKRKQELAKYLVVRFKDEKRKWWQSKAKDYKTTWEAGNTYDNYPAPVNEVVIKYNLKSRMFSTFFLLLLIGFFSYAAKNDVNFVVILLLFFLVGTLFFELYKLVDRRPKIILSEKGIWINKVDEWLKWNNIGATYIETDHSSEYVTFTLIIFHYNSASNEFSELSYKLLENLEISHNQLAYYIEYYKIKTGNVIKNEIA